MKKSIVVFLAIFLMIKCSHRMDSEAVRQDVFTVFYPEIPGSTFAKKCPSVAEKLDLAAITAVGDIMIGSHVTQFLDSESNDYPFDSTRQILSKSGFTIGNLEAPFAKSGIKFDKKFNFKIHPRYSSGLKSAGFDVVNLANNHIMDYGSDALVSTLRTLDSLDIRYCGAGTNYEEARAQTILKENGLEVAFLGCSMTYPSEFWAGKNRAGTYYPTETSLAEQVKKCEAGADYTVVSFHWGQERKNYPKDYQKFFAHLAIDNGADLILGHHSHVLQGVEIYKNRLIIYSLGNFAFGSYSYSSTESIILKTYLSRNGFLFARVFPISVDNHEVAFQPRLLTGKRADSIIHYLNEISAPLNGDRNIIAGNGIILGLSMPDTVLASSQID